MAKYIYQGNRDANNSSIGIIFEDQGVQIDDGVKYVPLGGEIELTAEQRNRLAPYFILEDKDGSDVGEGLVPPTAVAPDANTAGDAGTSGSEGNLEGQSSPSATSKKS